MFNSGVKCVRVQNNTEGIQLGKARDHRKESYKHSPKQDGSGSCLVVYARVSWHRKFSNQQAHLQFVDEIFYSCMIREVIFIPKLELSNDMRQSTRVNVAVKDAGKTRLINGYARQVMGRQ
jgi:hypothetical protein